MAFCTSCGAQIADGVKFCTSCGAAQTSTSQPAVSPAAPASAAATAAAAPAAATAQPAPKKGSGLKIVLIVLGIIFALILLVIVGVVGTGVYFAHKLKQSVNVTQNGDTATISTPMGEIGGSTDTDKVLEQLGSDLIYPGATPLKEGTSSGTFAGITAVNAFFESSDSVDQVAEFYHSKYPKATLAGSAPEGRTLIFNTDKGTVTVVVKEDAGKTKITVSRIEGKKGNTTESSE